MNFPNNHGQELKEMFRKLYPTLTEDELERAQYNFDRYIALCLRILERQMDSDDQRETNP